MVGLLNSAARSGKAWDNVSGGKVASGEWQEYFIPRGTADTLFTYF